MYPNYFINEGVQALCKFSRLVSTSRPFRVMGQTFKKSFDVVVGVMNYLGGDNLMLL